MTLRICSHGPTKSRIRLMRRSLATFAHPPLYRSYYEVLGVEKTANQAEIKEAYYAKSKQYHPDNNNYKDEESKAFLEVKEAYDTLRRPVDRRQYDNYYSRCGTSAGCYYDYADPFSATNSSPQAGEDRNYYRKYHYGPYGHYSYGPFEPGHKHRFSWYDYYGWDPTNKNEVPRRMWMGSDLGRLFIFIYVGSLLTILYNAGHYVILYRKETRIQGLKADEEILKSFLRQREIQERRARGEEININFFDLESRRKELLKVLPTEDRLK